MIKFRCSQLGRLLTNLPGLTEIQEAELERLQNKPTITDKQKEKVAELKAKKTKDQLPTGAITYIQEMVDKNYHSREKVVENKYLEKGNYCEEDSLKLLGKVTGNLLIKNKKHFSNEFLAGTPDCLNLEPVIDTKSSWDLHTFRNAELTSLYRDQIKGYCWLTGKTKGVLAYCLVNAPLHQINDAKQRLKWQMNCDESDEKYIERCKIIERNMIFDIEEFKKEYPFYDFDNEISDNGFEWDFDIHPNQRVKLFEIELTDQDIINMIRRLKMAQDKYKELWELENQKKNIQITI